MSAARRAVIYTRISLDLKEGAGVERQEAECRALHLAPTRPSQIRVTHQPCIAPPGIPSLNRPRGVWRLYYVEDEVTADPSKYPPESRQPAVRMIAEAMEQSDYPSQFEPIRTTSTKLEIKSPKTLRC